MERLERSDAWWGDTTSPLEIVFQCREGVLTVAIQVPWFVGITAIRAFDAKLQELFQAIDEMDGRAPSNSPVIQSRAAKDWEQDWVSWSREYSHPGYAVQFAQALEAMAANGIARSIH